MDHLVGRLMAEPHSATIDAINDALCSIPVFTETLEALKLARAAGAEVCILSDANHHYIATILRHHGLQSLVAAVVTNKAALCPPSDAACSACTHSSPLPRLHISPHQPEEEPHGCPLCPCNLCKGMVLDEWRQQTSYAKIVYVGDGGGDYCPILRLGEQDTVLCRKDWALHRHIQEGRAGALTRARVVPWATGADILAEFCSIFS